MILTPITNNSADRISALVIGKSGIGKTSLIRTIHGQRYENGKWHQDREPNAKVCVLSAEAGLLAIRDLIKTGIVEGWEIRNFAEFKTAYEMLATKEEIQNRYEWVFIDSLTEIASRCEEQMKQKYPESAKTFKMWADYTSTMILLVKGFRDLFQYNVVFTCLESIDKDENNRRYVAPMVAGKQLKERLPSYFDEVFYFQSIADEKGSERRIFFTQPRRDCPGKDRSGKLEPIEEPNLLTISNKILREV